MNLPCGEVVVTPLSFLGKTRPTHPYPSIQLDEPQAIGKLRKGHCYCKHIPSLPDRLADCPPPAPSPSSGCGSNSSGSIPQLVSQFEGDLQHAADLVREFELTWFNYFQAEGRKNTEEVFAKYLIAMAITQRLDAIHDTLTPNAQAFIESQLETSPFLQRPGSQSQDSQPRGSRLPGSQSD
ncbi:hypothetical protein H1R20_g13944, partial [Candolleomyces eurysporus]